MKTGKLECKLENWTKTGSKTGKLDKNGKLDRNWIQKWKTGQQLECIKGNDFDKKKDIVGF